MSYVTQIYLYTWTVTTTTKSVDSQYIATVEKCSEKIFFPEHTERNDRGCVGGINLFLWDFIFGMRIRRDAGKRPMLHHLHKILSATVSSHIRHIIFESNDMSDADDNENAKKNQSYL